MKKTTFIFLIISSLITHLFFIDFFSFTVDELNIWNNYQNSQNFIFFWQHFVKYDTHQPLFYLFWYPLFTNFWGQLFLRLPSLLFFAGGGYYWNKLFPYTEKENQIPWCLYLFSPFLLIYSSFFLPYSLLILASIFNYYALATLEKEESRKNFFQFLLSCLILIFTHYYGALQAILVTAYYIYRSPNKKLKVGFFFLTFLLFGTLVIFSDFRNDFAVVHSYRKMPTLYTVLGSINLLNGGRYLSVLLILLLLWGRKWRIIFTREFLFILTVVTIAYLKSRLISPSFEARYLLILIYPLYSLFKGIEVKFIAPVFVVISLFSLYQLQGTFGASFVTKYEKVPRTNECVGLFITPCPKFYFPSNNYICKDYYQNYEQMTAGANQFIVHKDHYFFFKRLVRNSECERMQEPGLYSCKLQVK